MKVLLKKDLKALLPGFAMYFMAGIALGIISLFAIMTSNLSMTVTALMLFFAAALIASVYIMLKGAMLFRKNLLDEAYLKDCRQRGLDNKSFIRGKIMWSLIEAVILVTEYSILFIALASLAIKSLPEIAEETAALEMKKQFMDIFGNTYSLLAVNVILAYLEIVFLVAAAVTMCYLAFGLCYCYFIRGRYGVPASLMTLFCIIWLFFKVLDFIVPATGLASVVGSILFTGVAAFIFTLITMLTVAKKM